MDNPTMPGRNGGTLNVGGSPGRRKGSVSLKKTVQELLALTGVDQTTVAQQIALVLVKLAMSGKIAAVRLIAQLSKDGEEAPIKTDGVIEELAKVQQATHEQLDGLITDLLREKPSKLPPVFAPKRKKRKPIDFAIPA